MLLHKNIRKIMFLKSLKYFTAIKLPCGAGQVKLKFNFKKNEFFPAGKNDNNFHVFTIKNGKNVIILCRESYEASCLQSIFYLLFEHIQILQEL